MPQKRASQQRPRLKSCRFPPHLTCRYLSCSCDKACCLLLNSVSSLQNFCGSWFFPELYEDLHKALKKPKRHHMGSFFAFLRFCGELTSTNLVLYNFQFYEYVLVVTNSWKKAKDLATSPQPCCQFRIKASVMPKSATHINIYQQAGTKQS